MPYKLLSVTQDGETVTTQAEFTLADGSVVKCDVPHFAPQSADEVVDGLSNRLASEQAKYDATVKATAVAAELRKSIGD